MYILYIYIYYLYIYIYIYIYVYIGLRRFGRNQNIRNKSRNKCLIFIYKIYR